MATTNSAALRRVRRAAAARERAAEAERTAILEAVSAGEHQTAVARAAGRSREHIRQLIRCRRSA